MKISAVIVAAGSGTRMGAGKNKVFLEIFGKTILEHTVSAFSQCDIVDEIVVVTNETDEALKILEKYEKPYLVTNGGSVRGESVENGIKKATGDIVAIHDGARALIKPCEIKTVIEAAIKYGAAAMGVKSKDTLKTRDEEGFITGTLDREFVYNIQTPQVFFKDEIQSLYETCDKNFTDDCALFEECGKKVMLVEGSYDNIKITTPEDMEVAKGILEKRRQEQ